ncbi:hypothetical protein JTB14_019855 [Gonioctena quinquepunctata]|nr:hypothetical protein JTB14_019855 [Gonioctena quinquepunctata]
MDIEVKFEHQRKRARIGQCYDCQKFGHSAAICRAEPVCRHCAGQHDSRAHPKDENIPSECSNCNGSHKSNYRRSPKFPKSMNVDKNNSRRPPRPPRPQEAPNIMANNPLNELLSALNELKDFIKQRPILASIISLRNIQGNIGNTFRD